MSATDKATLRFGSSVPDSRGRSEVGLEKNSADAPKTEECGFPKHEASDISTNDNDTTHISKYEEDDGSYKIDIDVITATRKDKTNELQPDDTGEQELDDKPKPPVKRVHRKGRNEYHCLDDVCILVRVPSSSTYVSRLSGTAFPTSKHSDESLEAYARQAEERYHLTHSKGSSSESDTTVEDEYDQYDNNTTEIKHQSAIVDSANDLLFENCIEFMDHITFAKEFVEDVIFQSQANVEAREPPALPNIESTQEVEGDFDDSFMGYKEDSLDFTYVETKRSFTDWPTIENFTVETGAYKIDEYLASFETEEDWMYVIYYQGTQESLCSNSYNYQAIFSLPTWRYPIAQATASLYFTIEVCKVKPRHCPVEAIFSLPTWRYPIAQATASLYFTIEVCKVKPRHCPVEVTYKYETFGHTRKPGILDFQEKWLHIILDSKIKFFQTVTY